MKNRYLWVLLFMLMNSALAKQNTNTQAKPNELSTYSEVTLHTDLSALSVKQKKMLGLLIDAAKITDGLFWRQVWGDKSALLGALSDNKLKNFASYNYGPWDRLNNDKPFVSGYGLRPLGVRFYPEDMSKEEFANWRKQGKKGQYSVVQRDKAGKLVLSAYSEIYHKELQEIASLLEQAAALAENSQFSNYLRLRAKALLSDEYQASDSAWMDMKDNLVELVIGPIESYQDALFGYRAAFETFVLLKDKKWSERLSRFSQYGLV